MSSALLVTLAMIFLCAALLVHHILGQSHGCSLNSPGHTLDIVAPLKGQPQQSWEGLSLVKVIASTHHTA